MGNVKKSVAERTHHQRQYDRRMNKRQIQTQESKTDTGKALDAELVVTESSRTESEVLIQEKVFAIASLKNELRKLKGNSVDTKFAKTTVSGKPNLQSLRNQPVVRQSNAFESERPQISKPQFASQADVKNDLSKLVTQHYLPGRRESALAKPDQVIASSSFRNSSKNMPRFRSNNMVHYHYLEAAKKKTQERDRNSKTSVMPSARFQSTVDGSKQQVRSNNQSTRSLPKSKSSYVTITVVPKQITLGILVDFLTLNTLFAQLVKSVSLMQIMMLIITGHRFSPNKTFVVYEKKSPRSDLRWKPTGRIFKTVSLSWIPTRKILASCTSKADGESIHGSNVDISKIRECKQTLDLSACTCINVQKEQSFDLSSSALYNVNKENLKVWLLKKLISQKPVFRVSVTTADASDKRQQQPDSTSSTSTLATTVTADGNFNLKMEILLEPTSKKLLKELHEVMAEQNFDNMEKAPTESNLSITSDDINIELSKEFLIPINYERKSFLSRWLMMLKNGGLVREMEKSPLGKNLLRNISVNFILNHTMEKKKLIMEYLVNISKRRAFWSLNEDILKINDSDYQYAVSIKEDVVYPCLHSPKTTKETRSIRRIQRRPIRRIEDIVCEDSGRYQAWSLLQETPNTPYPTPWIRRIEPTSRQYK
ncbi:hypothetical protein Tco_1213971 [Tanacetum coccineum]